METLTIALGGIFGKALDVAILGGNEEVVELLMRKGFWRVSNIAFLLRTRSRR
jgi:hypothetical protein